MCLTHLSVCHRKSFLHLFSFINVKNLQTMHMFLSAFTATDVSDCLQTPLKKPINTFYLVCLSLISCTITCFQLPELDLENRLHRRKLTKHVVLYNGLSEWLLVSFARANDRLGSKNGWQHPSDYGVWRGASYQSQASNLNSHHHHHVAYTEISLEATAYVLDYIVLWYITLMTAFHEHTPTSVSTIPDIPANVGGLFRFALELAVAKLYEWRHPAP